jgi:hypothetical protein
VEPKLHVLAANSLAIGWLADELISQILQALTVHSKALGKMIGFSSIQSSMFVMFFVKIRGQFLCPYF